MSYLGWQEKNGIMEPFYEIKYAESSDGIHWQRDNITCIAISKNEGGIACPTVIKENGKYKIERNKLSLIYRKANNRRIEKIMKRKSLE